MHTSNTGGGFMSSKIECQITQTHISTLQNIIARMSNYAMNCKTWAVTIVSALSVIVFGVEKSVPFIILFVPIVVFFIFDCYYLGLERLFRDIYDDFIEKLKDEKTDIHDDIKFSLKEKRLKKCRRAICSVSTGLMYGAIALIVFLLDVFTNCFFSK
jgi:hypothetical protein